MNLSGSDMLLYIGIAVVAVSIISGIAAGIILRIAKKKLDKQLEIEYGKRIR